MFLEPECSKQSSEFVVGRSNAVYGGDDRIAEEGKLLAVGLDDIGAEYLR